jgi:UDPglucose 6-dehydrogenase
MRICIIGTGYVGLVTGTCLAETGNQVWCVDVDSDKIKQLNEGQIPIYEPGLEEMVKRNVLQGRLHFTDNLSDGVKQALFVFIAVGTPPKEDGSADLSAVFAVAGDIGQSMNEYRLIVIKSTVPVGTTDSVSQVIRGRLTQRGLDSMEYDIAFCPEFLKEGAAVADFMKPDRVVVGANSTRTIELLRELFSPYLARENQETRLMAMTIVSAELTKYAANAMLATRISFMNELARFCEKIGADVEQVRRGIGSDSRIGSSFLYAGAGYGGSCFPKDIKALISAADGEGCDLSILKAVEAVNIEQKNILFQKITTLYGCNLSGYTFAIWGLSFKPKTDDIREAPAVTLIESLIGAGANIRAYDPVAMENVKKIFCNESNSLEFISDAYDALSGADALLLVTEWPMFRRPDFDRIILELKTPIIIDGRNQYDPESLHKMGIKYYAIGRPFVNKEVR